MPTDSTANRLRDAAWQLIRSDGVAAATSRAITEAAGANLGAITYHFGSKDRLVAEAITRQLSAWLLPALDAMTDQDADPLARVTGAMSRLVEIVAEHPDDHRAVVDALAASRHLPLVRDAVSDLLGQLRSAIAEHLRDPAFAIPTWVDAEAHAGLLVAVGVGIATVTALDVGSPSAAAMAGQLLQTLIAARHSGSDPLDFANS